MTPKSASTARKGRFSAFAAFWAAAWLLSACQSSRWRDFDKVQTGMDKSDVLELVGNPNHTRRWQGKDRWTYVFRKPEGDSAQDVHFQEGKVVYAGPPPVPKVSAEEQDRINEETNVREDDRVRTEMAADRVNVQKRSAQIQEDLDPAPPPHKFEPIQ